MRHIDLTKLEFPTGWTARAKRASGHVKALPSGQRQQAIQDRSDIWTALKPKLKKLSSKKCWYCESKEIRADKAVDHYRPKGAVQECPKHKGYWWLAFDWRNFRYTCQYCNEYRVDHETGIRGGKSTHFPLFNETRRVFKPGSTAVEKPKLLDPTVKSDIRLLTFDALGMARPRERNKRLHKYQRAKISIKRYNLNHSDLQDIRRDMFVKVGKKVSDGDLFYLEYSTGRAARVAFERVVEELSEMIDARSTYSMAARAALSMYKIRPWIKSILNSNKI